MAKYDFDRIVDRKNTNSFNMEGFRRYIFHAGPDQKFNYRDDEFIRMWVADMDFAVAPEILAALHERIDREILGYTEINGKEYFEAFRSWCKDKYDWEFDQKELMFSTGVIHAMYQLVEDLVEEDDKILTLSPAYEAFLDAANYNKANLVCSRLIKESGKFVIDFDDLEKKAADPEVKLMIFCNPHNPSGRIWTTEELQKVAEIIEKNDLWVISDEIHCDILRVGKVHTPLGKVMRDYNKLITCMSTSKTFNLAGMLFAHIIIRDDIERARFKSRDKTIGDLNPLSVVANKTAFTQGSEWLEALREYLDDNFKMVKDFLDEYFPKARFEIPEATYLAWVDMKDYFKEMSDKEITMFLANEAGVLVLGGNDLFVDNSNGYIRLNLAMPRAVIKEGLERVRDAVLKLKKLY